MNKPFSRRVFLAGSLAFSACRPSFASRTWTGGIVGASHSFGHLLREAPRAAAAAAAAADVVVVGGGMSGLIAALRLKQAGRQVKVIELEKEVGGNACSSRNTTSAFPWGAHYVPVPAAEMIDVCALLGEFGLGNPGRWKEEAICHDPNERLWYRGRWQDGLMPSYGLGDEAKREVQRFFTRMEDFKKLRGNDGRRAFAIPVDESSKDPDLTVLDSVTMADWMRRENFHHPDLLWHVDYGCRDDYGAGIQIVSAWAGIHYYASRDSADVFTWPEGNGWLVARLRERLKDCLIPGHLVTRITPEGRVEAIASQFLQARAWQAEAVVCAAPRFIAKHLIPGQEGAFAPAYAPWMVANLTVPRPISNTWDNVLRGSRSLAMSSPPIRIFALKAGRPSSLTISRSTIFLLRRRVRKHWRNRMMRGAVIFSRISPGLIRICGPTSLISTSGCGDTRWPFLFQAAFTVPIAPRWASHLGRSTLRTPI